jgi:hypothetical protein
VLPFPGKGVIGVPPADLRAKDPADADQRTELRELIDTRAVDPAWRRRFYDRVRAAGDLTRSDAADALFYVRTLAGKGETPDRAIPAQVDALGQLVKTRIIPGPLAKLFRHRAEAGQLSYVEADRWIREWLRVPFKTFVIASDLERPSGWASPDGYYGLAHTDGHTRCYRIHTLDASGKRVVEQITGPLRTQRRKIYGYLATEVLRAVAADPATAAILYARTRDHCAGCNKPIGDKDQPGYPHGFGKDCWAARNTPSTSEATA